MGDECDRCIRLTAPVGYIDHKFHITLLANLFTPHIQNGASDKKMNWWGYIKTPSSLRNDLIIMTMPRII